jgi:chromosome segregation ATPase
MSMVALILIGGGCLIALTWLRASVSELRGWQAQQDGRIDYSHRRLSEHDQAKREADEAFVALRNRVTTSDDDFIKLADTVRELVDRVATNDKELSGQIQSLCQELTNVEDATATANEQVQRDLDKLSTTVSNLNAAKPAVSKKGKHA